ncbi:MAG: PAS domain S-box protein [Armatimonadetes bacterium]|nr:PAS domain S-box protein [Armatimonadota bacterium]
MLQATEILDITEQKEFEHRLQASEERFRVIAEASPIGIFTHDADGALSFVNEAWCRITGISNERATGDGWLELFPLETRPMIQQFWREFPTSDELEDSSEILGVRDGEEYWARFHISKTFEDGVLTGFVGTVEDISDRKNAEAAILAAKEEAERANAAKNEFLSRMSHELRTPLNAILGFAQLIDMDPMSDSQQEGITEILSAGKHLLGLINEVLDIAKIEDRSFVIDCVPQGLAVVIGDVIGMMRPLANQCGVEIDASGVAQDTQVMADAQRLTQVMLNLVSNAIKYNRRGGTVTIAAREKGGHVLVSVADTGKGIPADQIERIFTPFDRLGAERSKVEGTGLGLALATRLTEAMDGELLIESEEGKGTTATVRLRSARRKRPLGSNGRSKVLLVEDRVADIELMQSIFEHRPEYGLEVAASGSAALDLAISASPDIVLLDVGLPDVQGTDLLDRLVKHPNLAETAVVVISADASAKTIESFKQAGVVEYLTKPIDVDELLGVLDRLSK